MRDREEKERKRIRQVLMVPIEEKTDNFNNNHDESQENLNLPDGDDSHFSAPAPVSHKRIKKTGTSVFFSHDILKSPDVVSTATRNNVTPTALSEIAKSLISVGGGDPDKVCLNYSTAYRYEIS